MCLFEPSLAAATSLATAARTKSMAGVEFWASFRGIPAAKEDAAMPVIRAANERRRTIREVVSAFIFSSPNCSSVSVAIRLQALSTAKWVLVLCRERLPRTHWLAYSRVSERLLLLERAFLSRMHGFRCARSFASRGVFHERTIERTRQRVGANRQVGLHQGRTFRQ